MSAPATSLGVQSYRIGAITTKLDSWVFPRFATMTVLLGNSGRIQLDPQVSVGRRGAGGPSVPPAPSVEVYTARVPVPVCGGPANESAMDPDLCARLLEQPVSNGINFARPGRRPRIRVVGLAHCRAITEAHGRRIWIEPNKTGGTTVVVSLPTPTRP